jgi:ribosomal 50S subunit-recycling heat shock protein
VACVFPTRSRAKDACEAGKVGVNGDRVSITGREGTRRELVVRGLAQHSIPRAEARKLYEDVTPPAPPEVAEARRLDRMLAPRGDSGRPDKRARRERIRIKKGRRG